MTEDLRRLAFDLGPNEASGLESFRNQRVLAARNWDVALWTVLDDVGVHESIGVLGHRADQPLQRGWETERVPATLPDQHEETGDAEAVSHHAGWIYIFGSHFGSKDGPLQRKRQFIARFHEGAVVDAFAGKPLALDVRLTDLQHGLHRVINDALREHNVHVQQPGPATREAFWPAKDDIPEGMRPSDGDHPINIEGADFLSDGAAFVGLRWPVAADGRPIVLVLQGLPEWVAAGEPPQVTAVHLVNAIGANGRMAGVRDVAIAGGRLHIVTGNIDSRDKGSHRMSSVLLQDHPEGADTVSTHFRCELPPSDRDTQVDAEAIRAFPDLPRIEGIAVEFGQVFYVSDEDDGVDMRFTNFLIASDAS